MNRRRVLGPVGLFAGCLAAGCAGHAAGASTVGPPAAAAPAPVPSPPLQPLNETEKAYRTALEQELRAICDFGPRNVANAWNLHGATDHLARSLEIAGFEVRRQGFEVGEELLQNLEVLLPAHSARSPQDAIDVPQPRWEASAGRAVVVAAHYDSTADSLGADAAASGAAALLVLAKQLRTVDLDQPLRLVWLANESGGPGTRGSQVYVESLRRSQAEVSAVLVLRGLAHYSLLDDTQRYPEQVLYGAEGRSRRGEFLAVVYNPASDPLFRQLDPQWKGASLPVQALVLPESAPLARDGAQSTFWAQGMPGLSLTDTAQFRNPHFDRAQDTPDRLDLERYARAAALVQSLVMALVGPGSAE